MHATKSLSFYINTLGTELKSLCLCDKCFATSPSSLPTTLPPALPHLAAHIGLSLENGVTDLVQYMCATWGKIYRQR